MIYPTGGTVINSIRIANVAGERGIIVSGEDVPACRLSGSHDYYTGSTKGVTVARLSVIMPKGTTYITRSVHDWLVSNGLNDWGIITVLGVVENDCIHRIPNPYYGGGYCWAVDTSKIIPGLPALTPSPDPCKDVSCPDKCIGVDKYDQVCHDGICVRGTLIETNSEHCGYTPEPTPEPTPDPTPTPTGDTYIIIALMLAGTYIILRR